MLGGGRTGLVECQTGACGKVRKLEWLGDMACIRRGVGMKVKVA